MEKGGFPLNPPQNGRYLDMEAKHDPWPSIIESIHNIPGIALCPFSSTPVAFSSLCPLSGSTFTSVTSSFSALDINHSQSFLKLSFLIYPLWYVSCLSFESTCLKSLPNQRRLFENGLDRFEGGRRSICFLFSPRLTLAAARHCWYHYFIFTEYKNEFTI